MEAKLEFCNIRRTNHPKFVLAAITQYFGLEPNEILANPINFRIAVLSLVILCCISGERIAELLECAEYDVGLAYNNTNPLFVISFLYSDDLQRISQITRENAYEFKKSKFTQADDETMVAIIKIIQAVAKGFWCTEGSICNNIDESAFLDERAAIILLANELDINAYTLLSEIFNVSPSYMPEIVNNLTERAKNDNDLANKIEASRQVLFWVED